MYEKIRRFKTLRDRINPGCLIEVDGGVSDRNIGKLAEAGVDVCVAGSYVFKHPDGFEAAIASLRVP